MIRRISYIDILFVVVLAACSAVCAFAQSGSPIPPVDMSTGLPIERGVTGQSIVNAKGGSKASVPSSSFGMREESTGMYAPLHEQSSLEDQGAPQKAIEAKPLAQRKKPILSAGGMAGAENFGLPKPSTKVLFSFSGRVHSTLGSGRSRRRQKEEEARIEKDMEASSSPVVLRHRRKRVFKAPKPKDEQTCDETSKLQLCTWL